MGKILVCMGMYVRLCVMRRCDYWPAGLSYEVSARPQPGWQLHGLASFVTSCIIPYRSYRRVVMEPTNCFDQMGLVLRKHSYDPMLKKFAALLVS